MKAACSVSSLVVAIAVAMSAALACSKSDDSSKATPGAGESAKATTTTTTTDKGEKAEKGAIDEAAARAMFNSRCAACHGEKGTGDGPGAAALNPKPRNYTDKEWQKSVNDEQIKKTIVYGGAAVNKSPIMPASPDLDEKPEVVAGLVKIIRDFGR